ncbi:iron(III) transport system substrate-binding protein [Lentibacillus halodurans]|uniref:Iron(III) transport system substrate-binding protein n=1 Tax=Lentibacillus halodurans TaxID=237679 RepID=A0A1I0Y662_9BACI|nr:ABC transporter substrate-binding protein [Lentibacillus halodurans]SFB08722.1 iron(III) transport system substrate-binding protein [Lentibacillus halodurans]
MKKSISFILILMTSLFLAACGNESGGESSDEPLKVYTHNDSEEMDAFVKQIEEGTGVELDVLRLSSGEGWSRMKSEAPNIGADMQIGMLHGFALKADEEGYLDPYKSEEWKDVPDKFKDPEGKWYGTSFWYNMLGINKDIMEDKGLDMPKSWEDLLDPQYKGEIVLPDPGTSGTAFLFTSTILQMFGEEEGWDYLEKLDENVAQYTKSGSAPAQMVAQGEYAIGITWDKAVEDFKDQGYPIEGTLPSEGVGYSLDVAWIFKNTDQPEKAEKVMDYLGSKEFMEKTAEYRSMVTKPDITENEELEKHFIDYDAKWASENRERVMEKWREDFSN